MRPRRPRSAGSSATSTSASALTAGVGCTTRSGAGWTSSGPTGRRAFPPGNGALCPSCSRWCPDSSTATSTSRPRPSPNRRPRFGRPSTRWGRGSPTGGRTLWRAVHRRRPHLLGPRPRPCSCRRSTASRSRSPTSCRRRWRERPRAARPPGGRTRDGDVPRRAPLRPLARAAQAGASATTWLPRMIPSGSHSALHLGEAGARLGRQDRVDVAGALGEVEVAALAGPRLHHVGEVVEVALDRLPSSGVIGMPTPNMANAASSFARARRSPRPPERAAQVAELGRAAAASRTPDRPRRPRRRSPRRRSSSIRAWWPRPGTGTSGSMWIRLRPRPASARSCP